MSVAPSATSGRAPLTGAISVIPYKPRSARARARKKQDKHWAARLRRADGTYKRIGTYETKGPADAACERFLALYNRAVEGDMPDPELVAEAHFKGRLDASPFIDASPSADDATALTCREIVERRKAHNRRRLAREDIERRTCERDELHLDRFADAHGDVPAEMSKRQRADLSDWLDEHRECINAVKRAFNWAADPERELIERNPFAHKPNPYKKPTDRFRYTLTDRDLIRLCNAAYAEQGAFGLVLAALFIVGAFAGLRPGELCALRYEHLLWLIEELEVEAQVDTYGVERHTKNRSEGSQERVVMTRHVKSAIALLGVGNPGDYVFRNKTGERLTSKMLDSYWGPIAKRLGLPDVVPYDLRHHCGTRLVVDQASPIEAATHMRHDDNGETWLAHYVKRHRARELASMKNRGTADRRGR